jgi:ketosteroid isomerase-like protein
MLTSATVHEAIEQFDNANERMLVGDCGPWKELMSHQPDVTLLGAYGGHVKGWVEVSARFDRTAAGYSGGVGTTSRTNISTWISGDLACVVDLERHEKRVDGEAEPTVFVYRTTHVLRRENGAWKVALRHADPLATFRGPDFAHAKQ